MQQSRRLRSRTVIVSDRRIWRSTQLSILVRYLFIYLSINPLYIYSYIHVSICVSNFLSHHPSTYQSHHPSIYRPRSICIVVICLGTHKALQYSAENHRTQLVNTWISKASATQRAGRTGRVRPVRMRDVMIGHDV